MTRSTRTTFTLALMLATVSSSGTAFAQRRRQQGPSLPQPHIQSVYPLGLEGGSSVDLTVRGTDLEGATSLWFDHPGLRAFHLKGQTFRVVAAVGTPIGHHDVRVVGTYGVSNPRTIVVGDRPEVKEVEPNDTLDKANPVAVNSVVNGEVAAAPDVDCFAIAAKKGQRILFDLEAERLDSKLDATLRLLGPDGRELAESRDAYGPDPFMDVTIPADGRYVVKVHDVTYRGSTDFPYRLTITDGPHLDAVVPVVARPGEPTTFTLIGRNLGGEIASDLAIDGRPLERKTVTLTPPASADVDPAYPSRAFVGSSGASRRGFEYALSGPSGSSNPVFIAEANDPVIVEQEPNDEAGHPQIVSLPCDISGCFGTPGDLDLYRFRVKKGEVFWIEAGAEQIGSQADPVFLIQKVNEKGEPQDLTTGDDTPDRGEPARFHTATVDASVRWMAPEDGLYQVAISDLYSSQRGDVRLAYRLNIRPERPDFHLFVLPDSLNQPDSMTIYAGGRSLAYVLAVRHDGFSGPIRVEAEDLPPGVRCEPVIIPASQSVAPVVFEADDGAKPFLGTARLIGRARFGDRKDDLRYTAGATPLGPDVSHAAVGGGIVWAPTAPVDNSQPIAPARLTRGFVIKVIDASPLTLNARPLSATSTPGGLLALELSVVRRAGFTEAVSVTLLNPPPGVPNNLPAVTIAKTATTGVFALTLPKSLAPGVYTVVLQAVGAFPFSKDPNAKTKPNVNLGEPSNPVTFVVRPAPVSIAVNNKGGALKAGASLEVEVTATRTDGSTEPVTVSIFAPGSLKLAAEPVSVPLGKPAKLVVKAAADSPVGVAVGVAVRTTVPARGGPVDVDQPVAITIAK